MRTVGYAVLQNTTYSTHHVINCNGPKSYTLIRSNNSILFTSLNHQSVITL